ncbi:MAG: hypothetical protein ACI87E_003447 [Mariniblastus sp.]
MFDIPKEKYMQRTKHDVLTGSIQAALLFESAQWLESCTTFTIILIFLPGKTRDLANLNDHANNHPQTGFAKARTCHMSCLPKTHQNRSCQGFEPKLGHFFTSEFET